MMPTMLAPWSFVREIIDKTTIFSGPGRDPHGAADTRFEAGDIGTQSDDARLRGMFATSGDGDLTQRFGVRFCLPAFDSRGFEVADDAAGVEGCGICRDPFDAERCASNFNTVRQSPLEGR